MAEQFKGLRPKPRVAIIGEFENIDQDFFISVFPTIWKATSFNDLLKAVDPTELDLTIINENVEYESNATDVLNRTHIISFSPYTSPPAPIRHSLTIAGKTTRSEFVLPDIPFAFNRQRQIDLKDLLSVRGWLCIRPIQYSGQSGIFTQNMEALLRSAVIVSANNEVLATLYYRESGLGVLWLPNPGFNKQAWIQLACMHWAENDRERFPHFGNWQEMSEWMTSEELSLQDELKILEKRREDLIREIDGQVAVINLQLQEATISANIGSRRLITTQGAELVDEVAKVFREIGFEVQDMDLKIDPEKPKREDLRLTIPDDPDWEAIVEVRGYGRSSGQTNDFQRLARFSALYLQEKGKLPAKRILVVNGEIEIANPSRRQEPFSAAKEDLTVFAEDDGLVVWSVDLFRLRKKMSTSSMEGLRESIVEAKGYWQGTEEHCSGPTSLGLE